jgi:integrase
VQLRALTEQRRSAILCISFQYILQERAISMDMRTTSTRSRKVSYTRADGTTAKRKAPGERNQKRLTEENVLTLPCKRKQYMVWDKGAKGLHVLVSPGGARTYRSLYYFPGSSKPRGRKLGRVGEITVEQAQALCRADQKAARDGVDPQRDDPSRSDSFEAVVNEYVKREQIGRKQNETWKEASRILLKECAAWKHRPIASVRVEEIEDLLERVRDGDGEQRGRPYLAVKLWGHLGALFRWSVRKRKLTINPMLSVDRPWEGGEPRDRVFSDDELRSLWHCGTREAVAAEGAKIRMSPTEDAYLKLLILTGKRRGKLEGERKRGLSAMRWGEINEAWDWTPPPGKKNKRMHPVPLPKLAQRILTRLKPKDAKLDDFVFPTLNWRFQGRVKGLSGISDFFPHAIRHTVETKLAELKVKPHIRDMLLDHVAARGSGKDYDHFEYRDEKLEAMELWADYVERVAMPEGVRALR